MPVQGDEQVRKILYLPQKERVSLIVGGKNSLLREGPSAGRRKMKFPDLFLVEERLLVEVEDSVVHLGSLGGEGVPGRGCFWLAVDALWKVWSPTLSQ